MGAVAGPEGSRVRVAAAQLRMDIDDPAGTRARAEAAVAAAVGQGAQIVVLPELALSGSEFRDAAEATARAEAVDGPGVEELCTWSTRYDVTLVAGMCETSGADKPFNTAVLVEDGRLLSAYRKTHLWNREKLLFTPGDRLPPVVPTRWGDVATMVCYDLEFAEMIRSVAVRGAQLIAAPSNWPARYAGPRSEAPEIRNARVAATNNRVAVVVADRVGIERGTDWIGGSLICDVDGALAAAPRTGEETVLVADLDLAAALDKRIGPHNDVLADRRTDLY